jgi:hypothetical protein
MSIEIATLGMFRGCCGNKIVTGGAPPYRQTYDKHIIPTVLVTKFKIKTINKNNELYKKITAKLLED